jgi:hypothetical protein
MLTIGIPLRDMGDIAWLQLESLLWQNLHTDWEVLIIEDQTDNMLGGARVAEWRDRARARGCVNVYYRAEEHKFPLTRKWAEMGRLAHPESTMFLICGGDDYSPETRFFDTLTLVEDYGADAVQYTKGLMYSIPEKRFYGFDAQGLTTAQLTKMTGHHIAVKTDYMRLLPLDDTREFGADTWILEWCDVFSRMQNDGVSRFNLMNIRRGGAGFCTSGRNIISSGRLELLRNCERPYYDNPVVPAEYREVAGRIAVPV